MKKHDRIKKTFIIQKYYNQERAEYGPLKLVLVLDHLKPNYNIGKIFRSALAFGVNCIYLVGISYFNPYPSKGSFRKVKAFFYDNISDCIDILLKNEYKIFALSPQGQEVMQNINFPEKAAIIIGHEAFGHSFSLNDNKKIIQTIKINQVGYIDSLNVSIAASIVMYEYTKQVTI